MGLMQVDTSWKKLINIWISVIWNKINAIYDQMSSPVNQRLWGKTSWDCSSCSTKTVHWFAFWTGQRQLSHSWWLELFHGWTHTQTECFSYHFLSKIVGQLSDLIIAKNVITRSFRTVPSKERLTNANAKRMRMWRLGGRKWNQRMDIVLHSI